MKYRHNNLDRLIILLQYRTWDKIDSLHAYKQDNDTTKIITHIQIIAHE